MSRAVLATLLVLLASSCVDHPSSRDADSEAPLPLPLPSANAALWPFREHDGAHTRRSTLKVTRRPVLKWSRTFRPNTSDLVRFVIDVLSADLNILGTPLSFEDVLLLTTTKGMVSVSPVDGRTLWLQNATVGSGFYGDATSMLNISTREVWRFEFIGGHARMTLDGTVLETTKHGFAPIQPASSDRVVVVATGSGVQAWDHLGARTWDLLGPPGGAKTLALDIEDVVVGANTNEVVALRSSSGEVLWRLAAPTASTVSDPLQVALGLSGDVLVSTNGSELYCVGDSDTNP